MCEDHAKISLESHRRAMLVSTGLRVHLWGCVCSYRGPRGPEIPESCNGKASAPKLSLSQWGETQGQEEPQGAACEHLGKLGVSG